MLYDTSNDLAAIHTRLDILNTMGVGKAHKQLYL
jgi:hypothetical protein